MAQNTPINHLVSCSFWAIRHLAVKVLTCSCLEKFQRKWFWLSLNLLRIYNKFQTSFWYYLAIDNGWGVLKHVIAKFSLLTVSKWIVIISRAVFAQVVSVTTFNIWTKIIGLLYLPYCWLMDWRHGAVSCHDCY